ncbi:ABC transporter permease [Mycobacterium sp. AT1]|uniref:ABC transporter permease n=1 Tax=Mycobacterium sp. AT1 TaxID=1961706 RepID=UPI0009AE62D1|nr:ABC transporter permease [Mycobacterium sp. AT1]OPX11920.1 polyamine ABC transporter permease [Mycobacterium sp. AT1]
MANPQSRESSIGWVLKIWVALVIILLLAPTLIVIPVSFGASNSFVFPPDDWSLKWYAEFFSNRRWTSSLLNSLQIALLSALLATALGIGAALGLDRGRFRGKAVLRAGFMAPQIVPSIVAAVSIYVAFFRLHLNGTIVGFVVAHTVIAIPFVIVCVTTSLAGFDRTVQTASASLGAGPWTTFSRITFPLLLPGIASGFIFAFVTSFEEVVIAIFLQTPKLRTLPVQMYESITLQIDPTIAAASSMIVVVTTGALLAWQLAPRRRKEVVR